MAVLKPTGFWLQKAAAERAAGTFPSNTAALNAMVTNIRQELRDLVVATVDQFIADMDAGSPLTAWESIAAQDVKVRLLAALTAEGLS